MSEVAVYTTRFCGYCVRAKQLLDAAGIPFREIDLTGDDAERARLIERSAGKRTVPQIFIGSVHVGGFMELLAMHRRGQLEPLLEAQGIDL